MTELKNTGESLPEAGSNPHVRALLPIEQAGYLREVEAKHFVPETAVGSLFTEVRTLPELLQLAAEQRGGLDGDDREAFVGMGVQAEALSPECRYLIVNTPGEVGISKAATLVPDTKVKVVRTKQTAPCTLVVEGDELPKSDFGTIIIGPNEKEKPEDPEPSTKEMVWSVHPGLPIRPATEDRWDEGSELTVQEVIDALGPEVYLNVKKKNPQEPAL